MVITPSTTKRIKSDTESMPKMKVLVYNLMIDLNVLNLDSTFTRRLKILNKKDR